MLLLSSPFLPGIVDLLQRGTVQIILYATWFVATGANCSLLGTPNTVMFGHIVLFSTVPHVAAVIGDARVGMAVCRATRCSRR